MGTDSFIAHLKAEDIWKDISEDVKKRFDTSNYEVDRPLPIGKNKQVTGVMKDELGRQIMKKWPDYDPKHTDIQLQLFLFFLENKKERGTKKFAIKRKLKFEDYKNFLKSSQIINIVNYLEKEGINVDSLKKDKKEFIKNKLLLKSKPKFKSERDNVYPIEIRKIALSSNNGNPFGMSKELIWKREKTKRRNLIRKYKNV